MADEQGTGEPDGAFARQRTGAAVNGILDNVGAATRNLPPQDGEPSGPEVGDLAVQDGGNWDPVSNAGNGALIIYDGTNWQLVVDIGSDLS
ncbi:hypothetical protein ACFQL1_15880 [Halomicroarcula sp. GCM10025709]|uniref:hypothetical protein n=1 Tax=Haloarcula TaxID=2237 RepID=UPI0024C32EAA|nr:hypothetical protein [Halomicroarcula sp. YJ-61-S]